MERAGAQLLKLSGCGRVVSGELAKDQANVAVAATRELRLCHAALEGEQDQICATADAEFAEEIGNMKFYGALGDIELAGDFFVGKILEERVQDFLLAAAEISDGIGFEAAALTGKDGIHEAGKHGARNPESAIGDQRKSTDQLITRFRVREKTLNTKAQKLIAVGVRVLFADDDEACLGMTFEKIGQKSASSGARGMAINDVNLRDGRFKITHIGCESGFELLDDDFEWSLRQDTFELAQHKRVRRENANRHLGTCSLGSHCVPA
jgi:hypothetical protein